MTQPPAPLLPAVSLGEHRITRLIVGGNPLRGYSHFSEPLDREMREYHAAATVLATWRACEAAGLNAMLCRSDAFTFDWIDRYRAGGGSLQWIAQNAPEWEAGWPDNLREILRRNPLAVYHHGTATDRLWKEGRLAEVLPFLRAVREAGVAVGLGTHIPEVLTHAEEEGWDVDFYMACVYNLSKIPRESLLAGGERVEEPFDDEDRDLMYTAIRATDKPCLAFKILGAGRHCHTPEQVRQAFLHAFSRLKPTDAVVVGMWQKHTDQVAMNAQLVRDIARQP